MGLSDALPHQLPGTAHTGRGGGDIALLNAQKREQQMALDDLAQCPQSQFAQQRNAAPISHCNNAQQWAQAGAATAPQ